MMAINSSPAPPQPDIPLAVTPEMNPFSSLDELNELLGTFSQHIAHVVGHSSPAAATASPSKSTVDLPDFGVFGVHANECAISSDQFRLPSYKSLVATMLLTQSDGYGTPQLLQTPSLVEASPDLELIAPLYGNRKQHHGTPSMANLTLTPTMASPHTSATGLYDMPGQFGFFERSGGTPMSYDTDGIENILSLVNTLNLPQQSTISPSDVYLTPSLSYTPGQFADTPSVGTTSPLLETPGRGPDVPLSASSAQMFGDPKKRASPFEPTKALGSPIKRNRSEETEGDAQASKKRKHTGTRPGISSSQLLAPGAPPQPKTYLTESSTSRKDVPASYKLKTGDATLDNTVLSKIVAKRTANRDSARRSRQRKQQAMELAQNEIAYLTERVTQLEAFCRDHNLEPPQAPMRSPQEDEADFD